jgi:uncharacterized caspase-like protein
MAGRSAIVARLIVAALCVGMRQAAHAEERVALVIGKSACRTAPALPNPAADAKLMSDRLLSLGFFVVGGGARLDLDKLNYLVPVDANPVDEGDLFTQMTGLAGILDQMEKSGTKINLLLLDACRNSPFPARGVRSTTGGLAQMQSSPGNADHLCDPAA